MKIFEIIPLNILILAWLLSPRTSQINAARMREYSNDILFLVMALPLPHGRLKAWAFNRVIAWARRELDAVDLLIPLDPFIGVLPDK
jgi:hypothetical protein